MDTNAIENARQPVVNNGLRSPKASPPKEVNSPTTPNLGQGNDSVTLSNSAKQRVSSETEGGSDFQQKFSIASNNQVVLKVIDPKTQDVVRQMPPEEQLRLREAVRNLAENFDGE